MSRLLTVSLVGSVLAGSGMSTASACGGGGCQPGYSAGTAAAPAWGPAPIMGNVQTYRSFSTEPGIPAVAAPAVPQFAAPVAPRYVAPSMSGYGTPSFYRADHKLRGY